MSRAIADVLRVDHFIMISPSMILSSMILSFMFLSESFTLHCGPQPSTRPPALL